MSSKYTPLVDQDSDLPPYELVSPSTQAAPVGSSEVLTPISEPEQAPLSSIALSPPQPPKQSKSFAQNIINFFTIDKAYTFRIKSSLVEERVFIFKYSPKDGFQKFRDLIVEKVRETTTGAPSEFNPFLVGYLNGRDLITISSDEEFMLYINSQFHNKKSCKRNKRKLERKMVELFVYETEDHLKLTSEFERKRRVRALLVVFIVVYAITFLTSFFGARFFLS
ncbi:hypothetical protein CLIB1423_07S03466 [[Candida] railenensis]|uniref:Uncharacterized protein n=1 Tax=[Candida] railenensis TaxID=45579 RepID=A0A9P0QNQ6_9ASCO|nr:hypothetical protein CLIB1423_07S03466 [[Candida] railenensis]